MKYSTPFRSLEVHPALGNRVRWGSRAIAPYWYPTVTWTPPSSGATRVHLELPSGIFMWLYGFYINGTTDCVVSFEDSGGNWRYQAELVLQNGRTFCLQSNTPLMGNPTRLTGGNNLILRCTFTTAPTLRYSILARIGYEDRIEELP